MVGREAYIPLLGHPIHPGAYREIYPLSYPTQRGILGRFKPLSTHPGGHIREVLASFPTRNREN